MSRKAALQNLGFVSFLEARKIQEQFVVARAKSEVGDLILFAEHPETLTLGKNATEADRLALAPLESDGVEIVATDRGGKATYHGPGQLVIYPVVSLRERGWGVKRFVEIGLNALATASSQLGVSAVAVSDPAGVWVQEKKIGAVGLRIREGVSNHGFSLNVSNSTARYLQFRPCGLEGAKVSSLSIESGRPVTLEEAIQSVSRAYLELMA